MKYRKLFRINEAIDPNRARTTFSNLSKEEFNQVLAMDPATKYSGDTPIDVGRFANVVLLPKVNSGDKSILDKEEEIKQGLKNYYHNPRNYPPLPNFKNMSTEELVNTLAGEGVSNDEKQKSKLELIYGKYYKDIDRDVFNTIIKLDPKTTEDKIGDIAKQLLLPKYKSGENDFLVNPKTKEACEEFYAAQSSLSTDKRILQNYSSVNEFIKYLLEGQESALVASLKQNETIDPKTKRPVKDDFVLIGSTRDYDIIQPLSNKANAAISGGYENNEGMHWCTGSNVTDSYWRDYTRNGKLVCFINKTKNRGTDNRPYNWQIQLVKNEVEQFLDGSDSIPNFTGSDSDERFTSFLVSNPDIFNAIKDSDVFKDTKAIKTAEVLIKATKEPIHVSSLDDLLIFFENRRLRLAVTELILDLEKIDPGLFAGFSALKKVTFNEGLKEIGGQAFKNCVNLTNIILPESLEKIGLEAFANDMNIKGSLRIPNNVRYIGYRAFIGTACTLKIDKNRKIKLQFDARDKDWVVSHVKAIELK